MAFKQNPGRSAFPKTGHGIPSAFKQIVEEGNPDGYNPKTSSLPNTENKGKFEKTLDKTKTEVFLRGGDKKIIKSARFGSKEAEAMEAEYNKLKTDTEARRDVNLDFLKSRKTTGQNAN
jgi:hypothetical protein